MTVKAAFSSILYWYNTPLLSRSMLSIRKRENHFGNGNRNANLDYMKANTTSTRFIPYTVKVRRRSLFNTTALYRNSHASITQRYFHIDSNLSERPTIYLKLKCEVRYPPSFGKPSSSQRRLFVLTVVSHETHSNGLIFNSHITMIIVSTSIRD